MPAGCPVFVPGWSRVHATCGKSVAPLNAEPILSGGTPNTKGGRIHMITPITGIARTAGFVGVFLA